MKTILQFTALATLIVALNIGMNASTINFDPEPYINDIPFNTEEIAAAYLYKQAIAVKYEFEEEKYIDDIPFNTECIAANCIYNEALKENFEFEEESYINDIPFNTEEVAMENSYKSAMKEDFTMIEEPYIDDIPLKIINMKQSSIEFITNDLNTLFARSK